MGSMPRLKIKDEVRYRKGSTSNSLNCVSCSHFDSAGAMRCRVIGLRAGARYRVRPDYRCDRHQLSKKWAEYCRVK